MRRAFRARGFDAWSCDLLPAEDGSEHHIQGDALEITDALRWDLMIAHPPCTHLAVSGARWFPEQRASGEQQAAIEFFLKLARAPIPYIAIENPVCIMSSLWRKPDQTIQPWMFGHGETKATCLWLKGLPALVPTHIPGGDMFTAEAPDERVPRIHRMPPGPDRWKERSRTYPGIAEAMAQQWGDYLLMKAAA